MTDSDSFLLRTPDDLDNGQTAALLFRFSCSLAYKNCVFSLFVKILSLFDPRIPQIFKIRPCANPTCNVGSLGCTHQPPTASGTDRHTWHGICHLCERTGQFQILRIRLPSFHHLLYFFFLFRASISEIPSEQRATCELTTIPVCCIHCRVHVPCRCTAPQLYNSLVPSIYKPSRRPRTHPRTTGGSTRIRHCHCLGFCNFSSFSPPSSSVVRQSFSNYRTIGL